MLTGKNKSKLRSMAQTRKAIVMIGKDGITDYLFESLWNALEAHELIKVKLLDTCPDDVNTVALEISVQAKAEVIQTIGRTIVLYKKSEKGIYKL